MGNPKPGNLRGLDTGNMYATPGCPEGKNAKDSARLWRELPILWVSRGFDMSEGSRVGVGKTLFSFIRDDMLGPPFSKVVAGCWEGGERESARSHDHGPSRFFPSPAPGEGGVGGLVGSQRPGGRVHAKAPLPCRPQHSGDENNSRDFSIPRRDK